MTYRSKKNNNKTVLIS